MRLRAEPARVERCYSFGVDRVHVRYLDERLEALLHPAIAHLERAPAGRTPDLRRFTPLSARCAPLQFRARGMDRKLAAVEIETD